MPTEPSGPGKRLLTKSAFMEGNQCALRLWFTLYEPPSTERGPATMNLLRWGGRVGELARERFAGGERVTIVGANAVPVTAALLARHVPVIFEAAFTAGRTFAAIDVFVGGADGARAIEVKMKSASKAPDAALLDEVAFEYLVLRDAGVTVKSMEVMRLNPGARYPDLSQLFVVDDVTAAVEARVDAVAAVAATLLPVLDGARPVREPGNHCSKPERCPYYDRCNAPLPADDIRRLYRLDWRKRGALLAAGTTSIHDLPANFTFTDIQRRQMQAWRSGARVVEPALAALLDQVAFPIAFLDFETISLPVPRFDGMGPWQQVPVQLSCHLLAADGSVTHHEWLAPGDGDPRPEFAEAALAAVRGAGTVVAHHAEFEAGRLRETATAVPALADELTTLATSLQDTERWLNQHVYDPAFDSSFSLKKVLPALLGTGYQDLAVQEGLTASALLEQLLWEPEWLEQPADQLRADLLAYCGRDTEALVGLWHELRRIAV